jgi:hypothetical protein
MLLDSSVNIVTNLRAVPPGFDSRQGQGHFFPRRRVQIGSVVHPVSYTMGSGGSFPVGKAAGV